MARKRQIMRNPNNYGTIKKLSGNRRKPFMVGVNPRINDKGSYSYDILGYYEDRTEAMIALAEYNKNPVDLTNRDITFEEVYNLYCEDKFVKSKKKLSASSMYAAKSAFKHSKVLHGKKFADIRHSDLQKVVDDCPMRHASLENIVFLFKSMYQFAMREDIVQKNHAEFVKISIPDDDEHGVRFSDTAVTSLWTHTSTFPFTKVILIYLYTGWRAREFSEMKKADIDLDSMTMVGGKKTKAGKGRIIPIHPRIHGFVKELYEASDNEYILPSGNKNISYTKLYTTFVETLANVGIEEKYTIHDCRHTFDSWLDDIGTPKVIRNLLMGHSGEDLDEKRYIHKTVEQLRNWIDNLP